MSLFVHFFFLYTDEFPCENEYFEEKNIQIFLSMLLSNPARQLLDPRLSESMSASTLEVLKALLLLTYQNQTHYGVRPPKWNSLFLLCFLTQRMPSLSSHSRWKSEGYYGPLSPTAKPHLVTQEVYPLNVAQGVSSRPHCYFYHPRTPHVSLRLLPWSLLVPSTNFPLEQEIIFLKFKPAHVTVKYHLSTPQTLQDRDYIFFSWHLKP